MRLRIVHATTYRYARIVSFGRHRLIIRPREGHDLRVERMELRLSPAHRVRWIRDVFGNSIALVDWLEPASSLTIVNDIVVERLAPFPTRELHDPWRVSFPPQYDALELPVTDVYRVPSFPEDGPAVRAWLQEAFANVDPADAEGTLLALCELVRKTVVYRRRLEKGVQSPAQTLRQGSGSCRDLATLMMDAARLLGVSARFASGYFHCGASMAGHASSHAWTETYLPTLGWRGFDPTTGAAVTLAHVVTGVSSHPRGVMPVAGAFSGSRADCTSMDVTVTTEELPLQVAPVTA